MRKGRKEKKCDFQHHEFDILWPLLGAEEILDEEEDRNELWRNVREPLQILLVGLSHCNKETLLVARLVPSKHSCTYNQGSYEAESQIAGREINT
jgi:hypothetical protein